MELFIFQCYPVCSFGKCINFGLGMNRSVKVNYQSGDMLKREDPVDYS